jgi:hypothetical protein
MISLQNAGADLLQMFRNCTADERFFDSKTLPPFEPAIHANVEREPARAKVA